MDGRGHADGARLRIASVPSGHVYIRHLLPLEAAGPGAAAGGRVVQLLPDPDPNDPGRAAGATWWPPAMLEAGWVREHADEFDVFHIHFGFDAQDPAALRELVAALREVGRPLVFTVHDLRNPHHEDRAAHDAHLDVLVPAADVLVTLTTGAAREIERRWGRRAVVLPHPHVVDEATMRRVAAPGGRRRGEDGRFVVGIHLKSARANMAPLPVLRAAIPATLALPGGEVRVDGHRDLLEPGGARYDAELAEYLRGEEAAGRIRLEVHDYFSDDELWDYLASLDASLLPYRFGTHSGWLEACRDLGTRVIAPTCGHYADQGPVLSYAQDERGLDADSLAAAIRAAFEAGPLPPADVDARLAQRARIAAAMTAIWAQAGEDAPTACPPDADPLGWDDALAAAPAVVSPLADLARVLLVGAHPDDETIGAGRLVAAAADAGCAVSALVATAGEACAPGGSRSPGELARERRAEWREAIAALGATPSAELGLPDGGLEAREDELAEGILAAARAIGAQAIVATWREDPHPDHAATGRAAARAASELGVPLVEYPVWAVSLRRPDELAERAQLVAVEVPAAADRARAAALAAYRSQLEPLEAGWPPVVPERLLARHERQLLLRPRAEDGRSG